MSKSAIDTTSFDTAAPASKADAHIVVSNPAIYQQFRHIYETYLERGCMRLNTVYSDDVVFRDPLHQIRGISALEAYFSSLNGGLKSCQFEFINELVTDGQAHITWQMNYRHKSIAGGKLQSLRGMTLIKFNEKVYYHEDSFDLGAMIYENVPIIGGITRFIKNKVKG